MVVFGYSPWLGDTLIHNPGPISCGFVRRRTLDRTHSREEFSRESFARMRSRSFETDNREALLAPLQTARIHLRIMLRDGGLGIATLAETTAEISLAVRCLDRRGVARKPDSQLQHRFGTPQRLDAEGRVVDSRFAVLSLGRKLGGNEAQLQLRHRPAVPLRRRHGATRRGNLLNREYFIRLAQQTTEGCIYRDTRAKGRCFASICACGRRGGRGRAGRFRCSHAVHYYSHIAHDWELQAMIKARRLGWRSSGIGTRR